MLPTPQSSRAVSTLLQHTMLQQTAKKLQDNNSPLTQRIIAALYLAKALPWTRTFCIFSKCKKLIRALPLIADDRIDMPYNHELLKTRIFTASSCLSSAYPTKGRKSPLNPCESKIRAAEFPPNVTFLSRNVFRSTYQYSPCDQS